jgi:hypothetical protein
MRRIAYRIAYRIRIELDFLGRYYSSIGTEHCLNSKCMYLHMLLVKGCYGQRYSNL